MRSSSQHLCPPAVDHGFKDTVLSAKQTDLGVPQHLRNEARNSLHVTLLHPVETCI